MTPQQLRDRRRARERQQSAAKTMEDRRKSDAIRREEGALLARANRELQMMIIQSMNPFLDGPSAPERSQAKLAAMQNTGYQYTLGHANAHQPPPDVAPLVPPPTGLERAAITVLQWLNKRLP